MDQMKRMIRLFSILLFLICIPGIHVSAAGKKEIPGNVKALTVTARTENSVSLRWTEVKNADGYIVYSYNKGTGKYTKMKQLSKTSCTLKDLTLGRSYYLQVFAYNSRNGKIYKSEKGSPMVIATPAYRRPSVVDNLRIASYGDKSMILKWNAANNATGYIVKCYDPKTGKSSTVKVTSNTLIQITNLTENKQYQFFVRSYRRVGSSTLYSDDSQIVKGTAKSIKMGTVHGRYYNTTVLRNTTAKVTETGRSITISAGKRIVAKEKKNGLVKALWMGREIEINSNVLSYDSLYTSGKVYSDAQAEAFVNTRGYTSKTNYLVWVNQYSLYTYIFKGSQGEWDCIRKMKSVVGKNGLTPVRQYTLVRKGYMYGGPIIYIKWFKKTMKGYGFHRRVSPLEQGAESGGCIRLGDDDLYYLDRTCPLGTCVISY